MNEISRRLGGGRSNRKEELRPVIAPAGRPTRAAEAPPGHYSQSRVAFCTGTRCPHHAAERWVGWVGAHHPGGTPVRPAAGAEDEEEKAGPEGGHASLLPRLSPSPLPLVSFLLLSPRPHSLPRFPPATTHPLPISATSTPVRTKQKPPSPPRYVRPWRRSLALGSLRELPRLDLCLEAAECSEARSSAGPGAGSSPGGAPPSHSCFGACLPRASKTGSLCCVAARPHGSSVGSREWSMGRNEPFWRSNTSFSPPSSGTWEQRFPAEGPSNESHGGGGVALSSQSSTSKGSRSWRRGDQLPHHNYSSSDGAMSYLSSPSDNFQAPQVLPSLARGLHVNEFVSTAMRGRSSGPQPFPQSSEGTSRAAAIGVGSASCSDGSECEATGKIHLHPHRNFSARCSFKSKLVHPVSFPERAAEGEEAPGPSASRAPAAEPQPFPRFTESANPEREALQWSSGSSIDFTDVSDQMEPDAMGHLLGSNSTSARAHDAGHRCGLCERLLSQRSPWSSRHIVQGRDMPVTGVLPCRHAFHAECLERTTPRGCSHDPPCPLCDRGEEGGAREQRAIGRARIGAVSRLRSLGEEGPSRPWRCVQAGDCVEGALQAAPASRSATLLLTRGPSKGARKELAEKAGRSGARSSSRGFSSRRPAEQAPGRCPAASPASPPLKRW